MSYVEDIDIFVIKIVSMYVQESEVAYIIKFEDDLYRYVIVRVFRFLFDLFVFFNFFCLKVGAEIGLFFFIVYELINVIVQVIFFDDFIISKV